MTDKEMVLNAISALPERASWAEIRAEIELIAAIKEGIADADEGRVVPHEEVLSQIKGWIASE